MRSCTFNVLPDPLRFNQPLTHLLSICHVLYNWCVLPQIEIDDVLRKVCENVLGAKGVPAEVLEKRAEAVEIIGLTYQRIALETKVWIGR